MKVLGMRHRLGNTNRALEFVTVGLVKVDPPWTLVASPPRGRDGCGKRHVDT